ncbi:MAG: cupin domain-containing protein [Paracoccaceae bacterium]
MTAEPLDFDAATLRPAPARRLVPVVVDAAQVALEGGSDPAFGTVRWRTLICGDRTGPGDMVLGVAEFGPGDRLEPHRHAPSEFYFGLSGEGMVTIEGTPHRIAPGVAIYIPGEAEHGVEAGAFGLSFAYGFARGRFAEVDYRFSATPQRVGD